MRAFVGVLLLTSQAMALDFSPIGAKIAVDQLEGRNPKTLRQLADEDAKRFAVDGKLSPYVFYLAADETTARVLAWVLTSTSRQPVIEKTVPIRVAPNVNLWRINIDDLGWRWQDWKAALATHPYGGFSLLIRGDWLVEELTDSALSLSKRKLTEAEAIQFVADSKGLSIEAGEIREKFKHELIGLTDGVPSYDRLLYGGKLPKTVADLQAFWGTVTDPEEQQVIIDGDSPVNVQGLRWVQLSPLKGHGVQWMTRDSKRLTSRTSALENPEGGIASKVDFQDDGKEFIWTFRKRSVRTHQRVQVQFYALADGSGRVVYEAPADLVRDYKEFRSIPTIRSPGSCVHCHPGIWSLSPSALVELSTTYGVSPERGTQEEIDNIFALHFGELNDQVELDTAEYEEATLLLTEWSPADLSTALQTVVLGYDAPLTLQRAAVELGTTPALLQAAIIDYGDPSSPGGAVPSLQGLLRMARGGKIRRDSFEEVYILLNQLLIPRG